MQYSMRINKDWRITLPVGLRKEMGIKPGNVFEWKMINPTSVLITRLKRSAK